MPEISAATIIIPVSLILMGGFAMTRITKLLHLPNVTAYITVGVLLGPACFNAIPQPIIDGTEFISDISLAFIAFGVGEFFKIPALKRCGATAAGVTLIEVCIVLTVMFNVMYFLLGLDFSLSIVLATLGARSLGGEVGMALETVIILASIFYEFVGPPLAKLSLSLSTSIGAQDVLEAPPPDAAELIEKIKEIREKNAHELPPIGAEEQAFTEAAEEQINSARPGLYRDKFRR